jgi:hypothetical protein
MNRRSFLQSILAAGVAPYVVSSGVLMPVSVRSGFEPIADWTYLGVRWQVGDLISFGFNSDTGEMWTARNGILVSGTIPAKDPAYTEGWIKEIIHD